MGKSRTRVGAGTAAFLAVRASLAYNSDSGTDADTLSALAELNRQDPHC